MSIALTINGNTYAYPEQGDSNWGTEATDWASAVTTGMLQKAGGLFQLLSEVDFGPNFGLKAITYKSRTANGADAGQLRLANADTIAWRNFANDGNLALAVNSSNELVFNGSTLQFQVTPVDTSTINLSLTGTNLSADIVALSITNALISSSAAIAYSKLDLSSSILNSDVSASAAISLSKLAALTASRAAVTDGSGVLTAATTTATEIGYVNGVTSAIQTQINAKAPSASPTFTGTVTTPVTASRALVTGASSELAASATTSTELGYVSGVTSAIQTQLNTKAPTASPTFTGTVTTPVTASRVVVTGASNELAASATTATEIGYVSGVTSAIQTQINSKMTNPMTTGGDVIYGGASGVPTRLANGSSGQVLTSAGGTSAPTWTTISSSFTAPKVTTYTSGSGTFTKTGSPLYIQVEMVGGGGGSSGSGTSASMGAGGNGGATTFGSSLLVANGGTGGAINGGSGVASLGGTASLGTGPLGIAITGGSGGGGNYSSSYNTYFQGGDGGASALGGAGAGTSQANADSGKTNTGGGAGGAGTNAAAVNLWVGAGGGAGGYVKAIITSPSTTYSYAVGSGGSAGTAGTSGSAGAAGGSGLIVVTEYYQ